MKFSIITTTYNCISVFDHTAEGVFKQTHNDWEWLIADDCSSDGTLKRLEELAASDNRIKLFKSSKNWGGPAKGRNLGLQHAVGDIFEFLDADDIWMPEKLALQQELLVQNPDVDIVHSDAYVVQGQTWINRSAIRPSLSKMIIKALFGKSSILIFNLVNINTAVIRANNHIRFVEEKKFIGLEDWLFWIQAHQLGFKFLKMPSATIYYRKSSASLYASNPSIRLKNIPDLLDFACLKYGASRKMTVVSKSFNYLRTYMKQAEAIVFKAIMKTLKSIKVF